MIDERIDHVVVTEDNGGGIALFVFDRSDTCVYAHTGYEYTPGALAQDIAALLSGDYPPEDWDGNEDDPQAVWQSMAHWLRRSEQDRVNYAAEILLLTRDGVKYIAAPCDGGVGNALEELYEFVPDPDSTVCDPSDCGCYKPREFGR